jgi:hypothetical protein
MQSPKPSAAEVYVNVDALTPDKMAELGVPTCCTGSRGWWSMCSSCCAFLIILPIIIIAVFGDDSNYGDAEGNRVIAYVLLGLGLFCVLFSLRKTFGEGGVCMPAAPPLACSLVNAKDSTLPGGHRNTVVKKLAVIVNPHGGVKKGLHTLETVVKPIWEKEFGIEVTVLQTEHAGHAREYAREVDLSGLDGLCVIGGDGSFHETVNGMLQRADGQRIPVGLIPGGSGNSVALDLGTWSAAEAARRVGRGDVCSMDINMVTVAGEQVASVNELSWGLVGNVGVEAEAFRCLGPARYE